MDRNGYEQWGQMLGQNWMSKKPSASAEMFSKCVNYRETPFSPNAASTPDGIMRLWNEILSQNQIMVSVELVCVEEDNAIYKYEAKYTDQGSIHRSSGVWIIKFQDGFCVSFEQFFNVET